VNAFNRKLKKIIKPYVHTSKLNLNMEREHFTKHGLHMNGSGTDRISELLTSRIMELVTTHPLETPIALPWKAKTTEEEENQIKPVVEGFTLSSPDLQINEEQGKHSNSVTQDSETVQNIVSDPVNDTQHSNKSDIVCKDSDNYTKPLHETHHKQTTKQKRTIKTPKTKSDDF
jgi:hypothetical protein